MERWVGLRWVVLALVVHRAMDLKDRGPRPSHGTVHLWRLDLRDVSSFIVSSPPDRHAISLTPTFVTKICFLALYDHSCRIVCK